MITLFKNTANTIFVTLSEKTTISDPNYLFEFKSKQTNVSAFCLVGTDLTASLERGNKFVITEKTSPAPEDSEVELLVGQYIYTAYQLSDAQVSALNFSSIDTTLYGIVEGPCQMRVKEITTPNTFYTSAPLTNTVYEG